MIENNKRLEQSGLFFFGKNNPHMGLRGPVSAVSM